MKIQGGWLLLLGLLVIYSMLSMAAPSEKIRVEGIVHQLWGDDIKLKVSKNTLLIVPKMDVVKSYAIREGNWVVVFVSRERLEPKYFEKAP